MWFSVATFDSVVCKRLQKNLSNFYGILDWDTHCIYHLRTTKKLVQHGNSAALIRDKPILELLNVTMETSLEITTDGKNIVISPVSENTESGFVASLDKINSRFSDTLRKLGE